MSLKLDIATEILNNAKNSDIEEPVRVITNLCEIEDADDLRRELFEKDGLCRLLSQYDPSCHGNYNGKIYQFTRGFADTLNQGSTALFVCKLYLNLRYEFNEAIKRLPDELVTDFIEALKEFALSGDKDDRVMNSDKLARSAAQKIYKIKKTLGKTSLGAEYVDKCINNLANTINDYMPFNDDCCYKLIKHNSVKLYGYIDMIDACSDKIKKEKKNESE